MGRDPTECVVHVFWTNAGDGVRRVHFTSIVLGAADVVVTSLPNVARCCLKVRDI